MIIYLCSCGFATDDPDWFDGHLYQHPGHHQRPMARYLLHDRQGSPEMLPVRA
jgi:hypothetical protein